MKPMPGGRKGPSLRPRCLTGHKKTEARVSSLRSCPYLHGLPRRDASARLEAVEGAAARIFTPPGERVTVVGGVQNIKAPAARKTSESGIKTCTRGRENQPPRGVGYLTEGTKAMPSNPMTLVSASRRPVNSGLLPNRLMQSESSR